MKKPLLALVAVASLLVPFASVPAVAEDVCPPLFSAHYVGTWVSDNVNIDPNLQGDVDGTIDATENHLHGDFAITNTGITPGTLDLDVACDQVDGVYEWNGQDVLVSGTLSPDGKTLNTTYDITPLGGTDTGTFDIAVVIDDQGFAAADSSVYEGGAGDGVQALAATTSYRYLRIPVTLAQPAAEKAVVKWKVTGGTAVRGVDYVDTGKLHSISFPAGATQKYATLKVLSNSERQDDRTVEVTLSSPTAGYQLYVSSAVGTIHDDD
jgi:hypothetical protein